VTFNPFEWDFHTWRAIFAIFAGLTLLVGLPGLFAPRVGLRGFWGNTSLRTAPAVKQWLLNFGLVLLAVGYLLAAWKLPSFLWAVMVGVVAKPVFSISLLTYHFRGKNSDLVAVIAMLDGIMAVFSLLYLLGGARVP
jgi:hypothetical protein